MSRNTSGRVSPRFPRSVFFGFDNKLVADSIAWPQADVYVASTAERTIMRRSGPRCSGFVNKLKRSSRAPVVCAIIFDRLCDRLNRVRENLAGGTTSLLDLRPIA